MAVPENQTREMKREKSSLVLVTKARNSSTGIENVQAASVATISRRAGMPCHERYSPCTSAMISNVKIAASEAAVFSVLHSCGYSQHAK